MWLLPNFGAEAGWRGERLSGEAARRATDLAPLFGALARPGDRVLGEPSSCRATEAARRWLPALPHAASAESDVDPEEVVAWCAAGVGPRGGSAEGSTWAERLRAAPRSSEEIVRRVHGRRWLADERSAGTLPPHPFARWIEDMDTLRAALVGCGPWVLKAPHGAAGRDRVLSTGPRADDATMRHARRALEAWGGGLLEGWIARTEDLGAIGIVTERDVIEGGVHRLVTGRDGRFRGIERWPLGRAGSPLARSIASATRVVGTRLAAAGYRGPFGIDGYAGVDATGREVEVPVGEVNARTTFGHLARCLFDAANADGRTFRRLALGACAAERLPPFALPLVETGDGREVRAWFEHEGASAT